MDDSCVVFMPASFMDAARMVSSMAASISVAMSASFHWIAWKSLMALPNCRSASIGCIECKGWAADALVKLLNPMQERRRKFDEDRKSTRLNSSHLGISYAVF